MRSDSLLYKLQHVQNATACMVTLLPKYSYITPVLVELLWLPITFQIDFKIILMVPKAMGEFAPEYLLNLLTMTSNSVRYLV